MQLDVDAKTQLLDRSSKTEMGDQRVSEVHIGPKGEDSMYLRESIWGISKVKALAVWTINDQKKLISMNKLYMRSLDYHRNVHTKESPLFLVNQAMDGIDAQTFDSAAILANVITFSADKSKRLLHPMNYSQLHGFCQSIAKPGAKARGMSEESFTSASVSDPAAKDYYWIHLRDLNALDVISGHLKMHDLIHAGFHDLRAHSTLIPNENEMLMTHVICALEDLVFRMYKMYIYLRDNVMITFEVELFPNLDEVEDPASYITSSMIDAVNQTRRTAATSVPPPGADSVVSPLASVDNAHSSLPTSDGSTGRTMSTSSPFVSTVTDRIMQLFFKNITKLKRKVLELGVVYIVYEISMQVLTFYDGSIEFAASSLAYFNRIVHLNLLHRERMALMKKIHMLSAGISLLRKSIEGCVENFGKLAHLQNSLFEDYGRHNGVNDLADDTNSVNDRFSAHPPHFALKRSGGGDAFSKITFFNDNHALYLYDIHDSYIFKRHAVQKQAEEIRRLEAELDAMIQLRTTNTNTMLSLIATTFLPLTFFAGVFGMNFTVDGGYSLEMLNASYGPNFFIALCLGTLHPLSSIVSFTTNLFL